jgi:hypothetical protein
MSKAGSFIRFSYNETFIKTGIFMNSSCQSNSATDQGDSSNPWSSGWNDPARYRRREMKIVTKSLLSAGAAAAALVGIAAPAQARHDNDKISAGEVIAGAVILGGIAAVLSSGNNDRDRYDDRNVRYEDGRYDDRYDEGRRGRGRDDYGYNRGGGSRQAVNQCVNAVETWGNRYSRTNVRDIRNIDRTRNGYRITGSIVVQDGWRGQNRYGRDDDRGYGRGYGRGYDKGRFTCYVERGRVIDVDYSGLDQWR